MKKIVKMLVFLFLFCGCTFEKREYVEKKGIVPVIGFENSEKIPSNVFPFLGQALENQVLLSGEEIEKYNVQIQERTNTLHDLGKITSFSKEEILKLIDSYTIPTLPKYEGNTEITSHQVDEILENRNRENVVDIHTVQRGIVVERSDLKSFPTTLSFLVAKEKENVSALQETEVTVNTPVLVLHESKDKLWNFVLTSTYAGWVKKENIALATLEDLEFFTKNPSFGVITTPYIEIDGTILDMGVILPYQKSENQFFLPRKTEEGTVARKGISLAEEDVHIGFLPYTKRNVLLEAFKYEGTPYHWGGREKGVDCSSFISNVYKTFGFIFPRNTIDQRNSVGEVLSLKGLTNEEKLTKIKAHPLSFLYKPGHVMLYLQELEGKNYIIHASGQEEKVTINTLENLQDVLSQIDILIQIP